MSIEVRKVSSLRLARQNTAVGGLNPRFVSAAIVGVFLTAISYSNFAPNSVSLAPISIFGAFTGLILFFIVIVSNPYSPPGDIRPEPFERMFIGEVKALAPGETPN
jgi:hypothetical protein